MSVLYCTGRSGLLWFYFFLCICRYDCEFEAAYLSKMRQKVFKCVLLFFCMHAILRNIKTYICIHVYYIPPPLTVHFL